MEKQLYTATTRLSLLGMEEGEARNLAWFVLGQEGPCTLAITPGRGELYFDITARAATAVDAQELCDNQAVVLRQLFGAAIYGQDTPSLAHTLVAQLTAGGKKLATAESCTGGMLSARLTQVSGASRVFDFGATTYAGAMKHKLLGVPQSVLRRHGEVSQQVAAAMAFGVQAYANADYGVGITGIAGPGGGRAEKPVGLVYIAACTPSTVYVKKMFYPGAPRQEVRYMATQHGLDMVRRLDAGLPMPGTVSFTRAQAAHMDGNAGTLPPVGALALTATALVCGLAWLKTTGRSGTK